MAKKKEVRLHGQRSFSIDVCMKDVFKLTSTMILNDDIDLIEFNLCAKTILTTITYLRSKRYKEQYQV